MTPRERFLKTLKFKKPDRAYYSFGHPRKSTLQAWRFQGLPEMPEDEDYGCPDAFYEFVGMDPSPWRSDFRNVLPINTCLYPPFEVQVLAENESGMTWRDEQGIVMRDAGRKLGTPGFRTRSYISHPVANSEDWISMRDRYNPQTPERYPENWDELAHSFKGHEIPLLFVIRGLFWSCRDWVGFEKLCTMFYDNPRLVDEMMEHLTRFTMEVLDRAFTDVAVDCLLITEDMAYKTASMISPEMLRKFMLPRYKRLVHFFKNHRVPLVMIDSDGHIDQMIPLWIEAGIDGNFPCEIAAQNDPLRYRRKHGKSFSFWGCIDKREIRSKERTYVEIMSKVPRLIEQGGFLPSVDHAVPPDVPLRSYLYMCELIKAIAEKRKIPRPEDPLKLEKELGPIQRMWGPDQLEINLPGNQDC